MAVAIALLLITIQPDLQDVLRLAGQAAPEAKWATPKPVEGGSLLTASETKDLSEAMWDQIQGPAQTVVGYKEPPVVLNEQLFLIKSGDRKVARIPWRPLPHSYTVFEVDLGEGHGYRWFSRGSYHFASKVRNVANLKGGTDPLALAVEAFRAKDRAQLTSGLAYDTLLKARDKAVPYVRREIERNDIRTRHRAIYLLGQIRTANAGYELLRIYKTGDKHDKSAVKGAAASRPALPMLRPVYKELLDEGKRLIAPAEAAIQYKWREFLPGLRRAWTRTERPLEGVVLYEAMDMESGKLPAATTKAARVFRDKGYDATLLREFLACPDPTYRYLLGRQLYSYASKGGSPYKVQGRQLIETVPADLRRALAKRFREPKELRL
jgi:hypothetical protein